MRFYRGCTNQRCRCRPHDTWNANESLYLKVSLSRRHYLQKNTTYVRITTAMYRDDKPRRYRDFFWIIATQNGVCTRRLYNNFVRKTMISRENADRKREVKIMWRLFFFFGVYASNIVHYFCPFSSCRIFILLFGLTAPTTIIQPRSANLHLFLFSFKKFLNFVSFLRWLF